MKKSITNLVHDKNFVWHMIGITLNSFYPLFLIIFITRFNGINNSGLFSFTFYFVAVLSTIATYGGRIYHVSDIGTEYTNSQYVSLRYITSSLMFMMALVMCAINNYDLSKTLLIFSLLIFRALESIADSYYGILQNNNNLKSIGKSFILKASISFTLFIILDILTKNILISSLAFIFSNLLIFIIYDKKIVNSYVRIVKKIDNNTFKLLKKCFPIFLFTFFQLLLLNITRYIVDIYLSSEMQGYFGIIIAPASIIALLAQFIIQPSIRGISEMHHNKKYSSFKDNIKKICLYLIGFGAIVSIITYLIGSEVLSIIYGLNLVEYKLELTLIVMGGIFSGVAFVYSTILTVLRTFKSQLYIYILTFIFTSIISLVLINNFQLEGALLAFFISMVFQSFLFWIVYVFKLKKLVI